MVFKSPSQLLLAFILLLSCTPSKNGVKSTGESEGHPYTNHLIHEKSPYLLQHAHNPVDWYPWGKEALDKAKRENKMLIISIGYSACHWCHVMEHESFEDTAVARIMNEHYVAIKVDREERPDIDDVYMSACQLVSRGGCGWPLNAFALPDGRPVWAGTYFPKKEWMKVLDHFIHEKKKNPDKLQEYASNLLNGIRQMDATPAGLNLDQASDFNADILNTQVNKIVQSIDRHWGGRKGSPKFPMPVNLNFLLQQYYHSGDQNIKEVLTATLDGMAEGGIYDQIGGGFARYSTDEKWFLPHFEKMLYDNGQLASLYARAYRATGDSEYLRVAEGIIQFAERELHSPEGGFYSSLDADSEGEEGKFYVWSLEEVRTLMGETDTFNIIKEYYGLSAKGNWEDGKNILYIHRSIDDLAKSHRLTKQQIIQLISRANERLLASRSKRVRPGTDTKILTAWNALMLEAYAEVFKATGNRRYLDSAEALWAFLKRTMLQSDGSLHRNYKDGKSGINAFLDDYALTVKALLDLYQVTFNPAHLRDAEALTDYALQHFSDSADPLLFYTSDIDPSLITRKKSTADNVIPASNSIMAHALYRLGILLDKPQYEEKGTQMLRRMQSEIETTKHPGYYAQWLQLYSDLIRRPYEIVVMGPGYLPIQRALFKPYIPNALFLGGAQEGELSLLQDKLQGDDTYIYVCVRKVCQLPTREVNKALSLIKK